jgi:biotin transport system substrate-specific component
MQSSNMTVADTLWPVESQTRAIRFVVLAVLGSLFVAVCAQINIPLQPVPVTMQTFAVLVVGAAFGSRLGAATLLLYVFEGAAGLPVFAQFKAGPAVLLGPTGGYIVGFVVAATVVGYLAERQVDRNVLKMFAATLLGGALIYVPGLAWLATFTGFEKAIAVGLMPFIPGDLIKAALAALVFPATWSLIRRR